MCTIFILQYEKKRKRGSQAKIFGDRLKYNSECLGVCEVLYYLNACTLGSLETLVFLLEECFGDGKTISFPLSPFIESYRSDTRFSL